MSDWTGYLDKNKDRFLGELLDFVRIPSISALTEHSDDVQRAAEWVANRMESAGIEGVRILPTGGHPVVYGEWLHAPGRPTILIYGHRILFWASFLIWTSCTIALIRLRYPVSKVHNM